MRVLSLFDGMSCGRLALADAGINVTEYHASEIDQHAIKVTKVNWPNTVQLGSVVNVTVSQHYDLLIGGSPCQSFSFAGKRKGMATKDEQEILTLSHYLQLKADGYEFEGQSYLFWEYVRILQECREINPNIKFLLENVLMSEKWERVITQTMGVKPIQINSALVSAQNRNRLYWTNIGLQPQGLFGFEESIINQPKDCGILLKDILETNVDEKYYVSNALIERIKRTNNGENCFTVSDKSLCLAAGYYKQGRDNQYVRTVIQVNSDTESGGQQPYQQNRVYSPDGISPALMAQMSCGSHAIIEDAQCVAMRGRPVDNHKSRIAGVETEQCIEPRNDGKTNTLTSVQKDNLVQLPTRIRRLTPTECERLQLVPDGYTAHVSDTQRYKMLGNGWTIKVISHIFSYILTP
jgi:DNA (cytosine-5)-methyltransferase 3A